MYMCIALKPSLFLMPLLSFCFCPVFAWDASHQIQFQKYAKTSWARQCPRSSITTTTSKQRRLQRQRQQDRALVAVAQANKRLHDHHGSAPGHISPMAIWGKGGSAGGKGGSKNVNAGGNPMNRFKGMSAGAMIKYLEEQKKNDDHLLQTIKSQDKSSKSNSWGAKAVPGAMARARAP